MSNIQKRKRLAASTGSDSGEGAAVAAAASMKSIIMGNVQWMCSEMSTHNSQMTDSILLDTTCPYR